MRKKGGVPNAASRQAHDCRENHFGKSSKSMEAAAAVIVQKRMTTRFVVMHPVSGKVLSAVMDPVVTDDDSVTRENLGPVGNGKGCCPLWIGEIKRDCDPGHRTKVFTGKLYAANVEKQNYRLHEKDVCVCHKAGCRR